MEMIGWKSGGFWETLFRKARLPRIEACASSTAGISWPGCWMLSWASLLMLS